MTGKLKATEAVRRASCTSGGPTNRLFGIKGLDSDVIVLLNKLQAENAEICVFFPCRMLPCIAFGGMEIAFNGNSKPLEELGRQGNRQQWSFAIPDVLNQDLGFSLYLSSIQCTHTHVHNISII